MAISVRGVNAAAGQSAGSATASTVPIAVTLPSGTVTGDRVFIFEAATAPTMSTPNGWKPLAINSVAGTGTPASGSGARYISVYYRDKSASWSTMPTLALASAVNNSHWVGAIAITPTAGYYFGPLEGWQISGTKGAFNAASTSYTYTAQSAIYPPSNSFLITGTVLNDLVTSTTVNITQPGGTIGTKTERCDGGISTGLAVSGKIHTAPITVGGTDAFTQTLTLSAASQGETIFIPQGEYPIPSATATRSDDFNTGTTADPSKWSNGATYPVADGVLQLPPGAFFLGAYSSTGTNFSLVGSYVYCQVKKAATSLWFGNYSLGCSWFFPTPTTVRAQQGAAGVTRTHTDGDWYRIREASGTVYWDYSTDGITWTNLDSQDAINLTPNLYDWQQVIYNGSSTTSSPDTVLVDNYNTIPTPPVSTLADDFNTGDVPDVVKWGASGQVLSGGGAAVAPGSMLTSRQFYNMTNDAMFCQVKTADSGMSFRTADMSWGWVWTSPTAVSTFNSLGANVSRTHSPGDWYRLRHSGSSIFWDYSTNGTDWTNLASQTSAAIGATPVSTKPVFYNLGTTTCVVDNFNGVPLGNNWVADATLAVTAGVIGDSRRGVYANASTGVIVGLSGVATNAMVAAATLASIVTPTASGGRGQFASASLAAVVTPNDVGRYDANAYSNLFLNTVFTASMMKILNGVATLSLTATPTGSVTGGKTIDGTLALGASTSGAMSASRVASGALPVVANPSADARRGQFIAGNTLPLVANPSAAALNAAICNANLVANVSVNATVRKILNAAATLGITAQRTAVMVEGESAIASLAVTVGRSAAIKQNHAAQAVLAVTVSMDGTVGVAYVADADLALLVSAVATFEGLREVVFVPFDDRLAKVLADDRTCAVMPSDRHAAVLLDDRLVNVSADDRFVVVPAEDRHMSVGPDPRTASVAPEITRVNA